jgi:hypothetical protein
MLLNSSEPVPVLSDKLSISTKQSAYQNTDFTLHPYFIQNKYVSHTINSRLSPGRGPTPPPPGGARPTVWETLLYIIATIKKVTQSRYTSWRRLGERRYSSYSFSTSALDGGEWSASRPGRDLTRGKDPRYPLYRRLGGPQNRSGHRE